MWDGARGGAKSARVSGSDGATSQAVWLHLVPDCTDACTRLGVGCGLDRFSGIEKWCSDCAGRRECRRAMARRRRPFADLVFPVTPMHALILARAEDVTDFATEKLCWDCAGGSAPSARVSESNGATAQAVCRPCVSSHTDACSHLGAGRGCDRFCHREIVLGLCRWKRTVGESVGEQWCDGAGRVPTLCFQSHRCILACSHLGTGGGWDRFCHREMVLGVPVEAHRRRECRGAMARRRRPFEDLGFAHVYVMCVWVV